jgi:hypothetical protein
MSAWVAVRQAVVVMDAVERAWGRELGLDGSEVMLMLLLARRPGRSTGDIAFISGRQRQHVWRSMRGLAKRGLVHATHRSGRGVGGWSLAPDGLVLARLLEKRLAAWEGIIGRSVELPVLITSLERMVEALVNRPSATGWIRGLLRPEESWLDPEWNLHLERAVLPPTSTEDSESSERSEADVARIAAAWHAMWK